MSTFLPHEKQQYPLGMEFLTAASLNLVTDCVRAATLGVNRDVDIATAPEDIWGGAALGLLNGYDHKLVPLLSAAVPMAVVSDSALDAAAGTGLRTVIVGYLDATYTSKTVTLTMNGTTEVPLPEPAIAINTLLRSTSGTFRGSNIGNVSCRDVGGLGKTYAYMVTGEGLARSSLFTVPLGFTLAITALFAGIDSTDATNKFARVSLAVQNASGALLKGLEIPISSAVPYGHSGSGMLVNMVPEKNAVWLSVDAVLSNNTSCSGGYVGALIRNSRLVVSN